MDDEEAKVIFCSRGGYGAVHLIGQTGFYQVQAASQMAHQFSDITALHNLFSRMASRRCTPPMARHLPQ